MIEVVPPEETNWELLHRFGFSCSAFVYMGPAHTTRVGFMKWCGQNFKLDDYMILWNTKGFLIHLRTEEQLMMVKLVYG